jgi:meiotic recombination protein SPO11
MIKVFRPKEGGRVCPSASSSFQYLLVFFDIGIKYLTHDRTALNMDLDLRANILNDGQPALSGNLLFHLPDRSLIDEPNAHATALNSSSSETANYEAGAVVSKIETIFEKVAGCVLDEKKKLAIKLKTRGKQSATARDTTNGTICNVTDDEMKTIGFPSKSPKEAWKFSR